MIERSQVQSMVLRPSRSASLRISFLVAESRNALRELCLRAASGALRVTTAAMLDGTPAPTARNLGLTAAGLRLAGITARAHDALDPAFTAGMRAAATRLGDGDSSTWCPPLGSHGGHPIPADVHAVVLEFSDEPFAELLLPAGVAALDPVWTGARRSDGTEPFGFRDDVTDPVIAGSRAPGQERQVDPGNGIWDPDAQQWRAVMAGEAVLGHIDESGAVSGRPDAAHLERDGSYLVIRKLEQDVCKFWSACAEWAGELGWMLGGQPDAERVGAQLVGRYPDGSPVGRRGQGPSNDFLYRDARFGPVEMPPSCHIRRANPRDDLALADQVVPRHMLFRRGYRYLEHRTDPDVATEEGLLFLACCADLRRQFEFVQSQWLQDGDRFGLGPEPDPVTGQRLAVTPFADQSMASVDDDGRRARKQLSAFVTPRGGEYVLLPGLATLELLGSAQPTP